MLKNPEKVTRHPTQRAPDPRASTGVMMVGRFAVRVFRQFAWLEVGPVKMALLRPACLRRQAHQRVTHTVRRTF